MKKVLLTALALALLTTPAWASRFGLSGSYWNTDEASDGVGATADLKFDLGASNFAFDLRGGYFDDLTEDREGQRRDFDLSATPLEAGLVYNFNRDGRTNPYAGGGVGYYLLDTSAGNVDDETGWYATLGSEFTGTRNVGFFVEGLFRKMEATVERDPRQLEEIEDIELEEQVAIDLDGLGVNAGVVWRF